MNKLLFPCKYIGITQKYKSNHKAIDMGWDKKYGGPEHEIISPCDGVVTHVKSNVKTNDKTKRSYGNYIKIKHDKNTYTLMAHLKYGSIKVKKGDKVFLGQKLAIMGNTGYSFGNHIHYEVIVNNKKVDPLKYTYYNDDFIVSLNTKKKYKLLYLESEDNKVESENIIFEYNCNKSGLYQIKLNEGEKLIIKE